MSDLRDRTDVMWPCQVDLSAAKVRSKTDCETTDRESTVIGHSAGFGGVLRDANEYSTLSRFELAREFVVLYHQSNNCIMD